MLTRLVMLLAVLWTVSLPVQADDKDDAVELKPHWKVGDKQTFKLNRTGTRTRSDGTSTTVRMNTTITAEIKEMSDKGFLMVWTVGKLELEDQRLKNNDFMQQLMNVSADMPIELEMDADAEILGVRNWKEVQLRAKMAAKLITINMEKIKGAESAAAAVKKQLQAAFKNKDVIEQSCIKEPSLLFMPLGMEHEKQSPLKYDDELPNPLGGAAIPSKAVMSLAKVDRIKGVAHITWSQAIDPEKGGPVLKESIKSLLNEMNKSGDASMPDLIRVNDEATLEMDIKTGWPNRVVHTRTTKIGTSLRKETSTYEREMKK